MTGTNRGQALDLTHFKQNHRLRSGVAFGLQDRWALPGMTRVGKTVTARELVRKYLETYSGLRVHILDPKDVGDYNSLARLGVPVYHMREGWAPEPLAAPGILIWHPTNASPDAYNRWFKLLNDDPHPHLVVLDELKRLQRKTGDNLSFPAELGVLMREGAGKYHGAITLIQEVSGTAREIMSQATHVVRFRLENPYDERMADRRFARARRARRIRGAEPQNWHGFWHARIDNLDNAREYSSWQNFL